MQQEFQIKLKSLCFLITVIQFFRLINRLAGQVATKSTENVFVNGGKQNGGVNLASAQLRQLFHTASGVFVRRRADRQSDQNLVGMKSWVVISQMIEFESLYRSKDLRGNQLGFL